ncbi:MAG: glycosyl hydrolase [Planctomycetes bacterium]|nr:glycosyl hydrolase [Planctomycetota bacterium]
MRGVSSRCWLGAVLLGTIVANGWGQDQDNKEDKTPGLNADLVAGLSFRGIGPAFMSGRIGDIAVDPQDRSTWYVAAASGGVFKTTNAGTTWQPIFDRYGSYSIGCVSVDPKNRHVVWVGTGENNSQRSVGYGDGVYKSLDGGASFSRMGLEHSEHIAKIVIHPEDSNIIYVAAQGPLWASGGDRGLYKSTNGGQSWTSVLSISPDTGVTDVVLDPRDPETLYAAAYQRRRHVWTLIDGGPEAGIHKSTDGGKTWRTINRGLPGGDKGRIGLAVSPIHADVLYAIVEATGAEGGVFRSENRGESWSKRSGYVSSSPQYYQKIVADPHVFDRIYSMDVQLQVSDDGGLTFRGVGEQFKHVDNHALRIDPLDGDHLIVGCDGGLYETWDRGQTYRYTANLPIAQFYRVALSNDAPFYYVYGGTQDNATQGGPSRTTNVHGIVNSDWFVTVFGDGFEPAVDPAEPHIVYSQWQYGGLIRFDRKTGQKVDIKPQPEKDGPPLRWNWDSALMISPHAPTRLYYGSQILFRSDDRGDSWRAISPDLTRNLDRNQLKVMGRVWGVDAVAKNMSTSFYGTIVSLSESPLVDGLLYVGTDDGLVQVSEDGGANWRKIEEFKRLDIPEYAYVSDIEASLHDPNTVYVSLDNHKRGDFRPYIVMSADRGKTWSSMAGDLPERGSVYCLKQDHVRPELLFAGTEFGVFTTLDGGGKWIPLKSGIPTIAVRDLEIQQREDDLVVASFGRGFFVLDDYTPLRELSTSLIDQAAHLFATPKALLYIPDAPMSGDDKAFQGAAFFTAPNPPFGAVFTYYLKESLRSKKDARMANDRDLARSGKDAPYPSWDDLRAEDREEEPAMVMTIRDASGSPVRRMRVPSSQGIHRVAWDFRYPGTTPVRLAGDGYGPLVLPGRYTVSLSKFRDGELTEVIPAAPFDVETLGSASIPEVDRPAALAFQRQTAELQRAVHGAREAAGAAMDQVRYMKHAIDTLPQLDPQFAKDIRSMEIRLLDLVERFDGDPTKPKRQEPGYPGILDRVQTVVYGHWSATTGPTQTHRRSYEIAAQEFDAVLADLRKLIEEELVAFGLRLEEAGAPWTPGRKIPTWKR